MSKSVPSSVAGAQPIPGYTLRKRLGAGGYGEVWLADAPGGLQKAVKLIYGNVDESRAASELRSLERIRRANHPFLLSIERIEVVHGRVVIVTELAESSLQDRFEICRRKSKPGIPRTELLDFLRDTADALDFLAQKHSLQHLDVKPGNLLIVADRVKVADFGLVKDLHESNQSIVGGLTPTYSAPEVFDGRPNFRSDQYSLAIVYMEMLTGRLPFTGSSAGELARQHLNQAPNLDPLPPADRNIVRRALSKNPLDRYGTCRQFIEQLCKVRSSVVPVMDAVEKSDLPASDMRNSSRPTGLTRSWTSEHGHAFKQAIAREQIEKAWNPPRCLFIGLGGQGVLAIRELRRDLLQDVDSKYNCDDHEWLAIDTCQNELNEVVSGKELERIPWEAAVSLPVLSPHHYRKFDAATFTPLSRRWLYNVPRSLTTEGVRPIATLSLVAHYAAMQGVIEKKIATLIDSEQEDPQDKTPLNIYVMGSLHGGTGGALLAEIGMMVRSVMAKFKNRSYRLSAAVSIATTSNSQVGASLPAANALASLSELIHWMDPDRERPQIDFRTGFATTNECPFEWVTLVDGGLLEDRAAKAQNPRNIARIVALDCHTRTSAALDEPRRDARFGSTYGWLRTACAATIKDIPELTPEIIAQWCCLQSIRSTRAYLIGSTQEASQPVHDEATHITSSINQMPLTDEAFQEFNQRVLRDLGFTKHSEEILSSGEAVNQWQNRISDDASTRQTQVHLDALVLQAAIERVVAMRVYNWKQSHQFYRKAIEAIQKFGSQRSKDLIDQLEMHKDLLVKPSQLSQKIQDYFIELSQACLASLEASHSQSQQLIRHLDHWWNSLQQDKNSSGLCQVERAALPPQVQHLCDRVKSQLDAKFNRRLLSLVDLNANALPVVSLLEKRELRQPEDEVTKSYSQMLVFAVDLVTEFCKEMQLTPEDFRGGVYHHTVIPTKEVGTFLPPLVAGGGELHRLIVASEELYQQVGDSIDNLGIGETTTLLPGSQSMGVHLMCDASQLNIPHLVVSLWRPSGATLSLAERLRTRVDIDWDPVSKLLDFEQASSMTVETESKSNCTTSPNEDATATIMPCQSAFDGGLPMTGDLASAGN